MTPKSLALLVAVAAMALAPAPSAQVGSFSAPVPTFRVPTGLTPCSLEDVVTEFASSTRVLVGFESTSDCQSSQTDPSVPGSVLTGMTTRTALDHLMTLDASYGWNELDGVAVARPAAAWSDPDNTLHRPVGSFTFSNSDVIVILQVLTRTPTPPARGSLSPLLARRISVTFPGGTLLEALNAIVRAHQDIGWYAFVGPVPQTRDLYPWFVLRIKATDGSSVGFMTPLSQLRTPR
jgi:hypothetical protein